MQPQREYLSRMGISRRNATQARERGIRHDFTRRNSVKQEREAPSRGLQPPVMLFISQKVISKTKIVYNYTCIRSLRNISLREKPEPDIFEIPMSISWRFGATGVICNLRHNARNAYTRLMNCQRMTNLCSRTSAPSRRSKQQVALPRMRRST